MQMETPAERLRSLLPQVFAPQPKEGELFVKLQVVPQVIVSIPLVSIAEVSLVMASEITPIPNMPDSVLGLFNTKGYVFWLIDLAYFLGFSSTLSRVKSYEMVMVRAIPKQHSDDATPTTNSSEQLIGLAVHHIQGSFRMPASDIQTSDAGMKSRITSELLAYVDAYILNTQKPLPILNIEKMKTRLIELGQAT
ncbi:MAG: CheW domain-containing protein [Cyanothece sp. SIO2G6]|nr:CheW domain-containing protein [Cyanothece sp. SIO2G6]